MQYDNLSKGPLYGKNLYIPFLIHYNFPSISASGGKKFEFNYHFSFYAVSDFYIDQITTYPFSNNIDKVYLSRNYDSFVTELGTSFFVLKNLQVGSDFRLFLYTDDYLNTIVEWFHSTFGFPNGGREYAPNRQIYININNQNNEKLYLDKTTVSFGDIDLWVKYTFFERKRFAFAAFGAFKIPTGRVNELSGSGYPDFAFSILGDLKPFWILTFYVQSGLVVPIESFLPNVIEKPYPMFQGLLGVELNPAKIFSLVVQFNIKTSPLKGNYPHWYFMDNDYLSLPQVNTLVGVIFKYQEFLWQFYVEEDSFTNQGTDITFNLMFSHSINLNRRF